MFEKFEKHKNKLENIVIPPDIFCYSASEYRDAFIELCHETNTKYEINDTYCNSECNDWFLQTEAVDRIINAKLKKLSNKESIECVSECFLAEVDNGFNWSTDESNIIINHCSLDKIMESDNKLTLQILPCRIGLVCEYIKNSVWEKKIVSIMGTIGDFRNTINSLVGRNGNKFSSVLAEHESDYNSILHNVKTGNINDEVREQINRFSKLHPVWSFIRLSNDQSDEKNIPDPIMRDNNNRAINDININTKIVNSPKVISDNFDKGLIENIICSLVGGYFPEEIISVQFTKTIAVQNRFFHEGYRVRIIINSKDAIVISSMKRYIQEIYLPTISFGSDNFHGEKYIGDDCDYTKCIINITDNTRPKNSTQIYAQNKTQSHRNTTYGTKTKKGGFHK